MAAISVVVMMGVSGAGKSTIARRLASVLGWDFAEGDELHSAANVAKMAAGEPLTDADRRPWLEQVAHWIDTEIKAGRSGVVTCSALKHAYRDMLRRPQVLFVYLSVPRADLEQRLASRPRHYMPAACSIRSWQHSSGQPPMRRRSWSTPPAARRRTVEQIRKLLLEAGPVRGPSA